MKHIHAAKEYKRALVIRLFEKGSSDLEISELSDFSLSWVRQLRKVYERTGKSAMELHKPGGSTCRLSAEDLSTLRLLLDQGASAHGLTGNFWDRKRVKHIIKTHFNVDYEVTQVGRILSKINYTLQKPRKRDFRQDVAKVATWTEETLPEIKKK